MTPPAYAQRFLTPEGAVAAIPEGPDAAALELLERLVIESHRASAAAQKGDTESLHELLDVRAEMIGRLEEMARLVAPRVGPYHINHKQAEAARAQLLVKSNELQQLNVRLLHCVRAEAARLSVSIAALDRGESTEEAYRAPQTERTPNLDLMR